MKKYHKLANSAFSILLTFSLLFYNFPITELAFAEGEEPVDEPAVEEVVVDEPEEIVEPEPEPEVAEEEIVSEEVIDETEEPVEDPAQEEPIEEIPAEEPTESDIPASEEIVAETPIVETETGGGGGVDEEEVGEITEVILPPLETIPEQIDSALESADLENVFEEVKWVANEDESFTMPELVVGKEYIAPQNPDVRITFNVLPETPGTLTITEITLTEEQVAEFGLTSPIVYDITSDMEDGSFQFDLTLPLPEEMQGQEVEVKSAESVDDLAEAEVETGEQEQVLDTITIKGLDHFTVFFYVTTTPTPDTGEDVLINEVVVDESGTGDEWVELYNNTGSTISLVGWHLKDKADIDGATAGEDISALVEIPAHGFVVYERGSGWLNNSSPEQVGVYDAGDNLVDLVGIDDSGDVQIDHYPAEGESVGRTHEGGDDWFVFAKSTKGERNAFSVCVVGCDFVTIQGAIDDTKTDDGDTIVVYDGNYPENIVIDSDITFESKNDPGATTISGTGSPVINIQSDGVTIDGFTVTNDHNNGMGIYAVDQSDILIQNNVITGIGNSGDNITGRGIVIVSSSSPVDNVQILNNEIYDITSGLRTGSASMSSSGIAIGWSNGNEDITNLIIDGNEIYDIDANTSQWNNPGTKGQGANGIILNHGTSAQTIAPQILNNTIYDLEGLWTHAIGLEGDTPNAVVTGNVISDLTDHKSPSDGVGIFFEANPSAGTVIVEFNSFESMGWGVAIHPGLVEASVTAENNWWGDASGPSAVASGSGVGVGPNVSYCPFLITNDLEDPSYGGECLAQITGRTFIDQAVNGLLLSADGDYPNGMLDGFTVRLYENGIQ